MVSKIRFQLDISQQEYLRYYSGSAQFVIVQAEDGRRLQLPAANLRPFVSAAGIQGRFEMLLDEDNKLLELIKLR